MLLILKLLVGVVSIISTVLNITTKKPTKKSAANFEFHYANANKRIFFYLKINK